MKYLHNIVFIFFLFFTFEKANANLTLSPQSKVSLITCGSGEDLYALFGHTSLRIQDSTTGMDLVFNYGTFNFSTEGFYVKFVRGKLDYELSVSSYAAFVETYHEEDRTVKQQVLNLNLVQKQKIFDFLAWNYQPENRTYKYDFFYDNCSTRIRDVLEKGIGYSFYTPTNSSKTTFRKMLDPYIVSMPWIKAGIYLALGKVTDKIPDTRNKMFLPNELYKCVANAYLRNGKLIEPLVSKSDIIYKEKNAKNISVLDVPTYWGYFLVISVLVLSILEYFNKVKLQSFDRIFWISSSLIGVFILFLWFFTDHISTKMNLNLSWASPFWLLLLFIPKVSKIDLYKQVILVLTMFSFLSIVAIFVSGQAFHVLWICFAIVLFIRSLANLFKVYKISNSSLTE